MQKNIEYRADIDGLRAIAIISVVVFHAFPNLISGGFVGVDIFFVISGFLISSILIKSIQNNNFSYIDFYARRIRRIFPALLLVIVVTWLLGWLFLFPDEFQQLGKHIIGGIGFISNFILWEEVGYFDSDAEAKPLLHLWSLGIEEQFYFLWPVLLWIAWKYNNRFLVLIVFITLSSFSLNIYALYKLSPETLFYSPLGRIWELSIGAILAFLLLKSSNIDKKVSNLLSLLGISIILLAVSVVEKGNFFPGWWVILPVFGTVCLILSKDSWFNENILSNKIVVYIGLVSYPLYLWHWVLLSYLNIVGLNQSIYIIVTIFISVILAILTYEKLEKKVKSYINIKILAVYLLLTSLVFLLVGFITFNGNISPRNNSVGVQIASTASNDWEFPNHMERIEINGIGVYVKKSSEEKVLFFGDSHIQQYSPRIVKVIDDNPLNSKTAILATRGNCPPIPNLYDDDNPRCNLEYRRAIIDYALSHEVDSVVLGFAWGHLSMKEDHDFYYMKNNEKIPLSIKEGIDLAYNSLESLITSLSKYKDVYLIIDNPAGNELDPKSFFSGTRITGVIDQRAPLYKYPKEQQDVGSRLSELAQRSGALIIDTVSHFCPKNECRIAQDDGSPIFKDAGHIRSGYAKEQVKYLDAIILKN